jgi:hypothetical protein
MAGAHRCVEFGHAAPPVSKLEGVAVHAGPDQARSPSILIMTSAVLRLVLS